jgi:hypothetical protein
MFGGTSGIGYGFALRLANDALPERRGLPTGTVVSACALGPVLFLGSMENGIRALGKPQPFS